MIRFQTLGSLDLSDDDGRDCGELLTRHKRVALLAYLAIEYADRFCSRDTLVALLWPEHDSANARNALSQALHLLRRVLGVDAIVNRGSEVGVASERLTCDAAQVRALARDGQFEAAVSAYTGDFLPGFFVSGAPEFAEWLEAKRVELRGLAGASAWKASEAKAAVGRLDEAIVWADRALQLSPDDEAGLRRMLRLLDAAGNRARALAVFDAFAHHLAQDFELAPSAETRALVDEIKSRGAVTQAVEVVRATAPRPDASAAAAAELSQAALAIAQRPARRSHARRFAPLAGIAAIAAGALVLAASWSRRHGDIKPHTIAVLPFSVRGDSAAGYLGEGVADLLSAQLADGHSLRSADAHAVLTLAHRAGRSATDPDSARAIARRVGAEGYILGTVVEIMGRVRIDASLYDAAGHLSTQAHAGPVDEHDLFDVVDDLAARLFSTRPGARGSDLVRVAEATTASLPALTAFLEGETDFHAGRYTEAVAAFRRAVAADPTFAIAHYRLAIAGLWAGTDILGPLQRAHRYADRLPQHQRQLVDAGLAWRSGENTRAEELYRAIVAQFPDDVEAWNQLVELFFHTNAARGRDPAEAAAAAQHVLALDPQNAEAVWHLALLAAGDRAAFDTLTSRALGLGPDATHSLDIRALRAQVLGSTAERAQIARELAATHPAFAAVVALRTAVFAGDPRRAREVMTNPTFDKDKFTRALAAQRRARFDEAAGRLDAARRDVDELRPLDRGAYALERAALDLLPYATPSSDELRGAARELAEWDAAHDAGLGKDNLFVARPYFAALRLHLLARLGVRAGDSASAARYTASLASLASLTDSASDDRAPLISSLVHSARAFQLAGRGDHAAALSELDSTYREVWYASAGESAPYAQAAERYLRAEELEKLGRDDEAVRWYGTAELNSLDDLSFLAISHLRRGRIYERRGDAAKARAQYASAAMLWRDGAPQRR